MTTDTRNPSSSLTNEPGVPRRRRLGYLVPIAVFAVLVVVFAIGLTLNPRELPSPLIGKAVPEFARDTLVPMIERLRATGKL